MRGRVAAGRYLPGTTHRYKVWLPSLLDTCSVRVGAQSPMSKLCDTILAPGRSSRSSFGRSRRLRSGDR